MYAEQVAAKVMEQKQADHVSILIMNPQNGEIYAMANVPEFNLNEPFVLNYDAGTDMDAAKKQELLNQMWRNHASMTLMSRDRRSRSSRHPPR